MSKQIMFDDTARRKVLVGVQKLARAVKVTLGPRGKNVIFNRSFGGPNVTKDGVTVSKEVEIEDPFENMGAKLVNEVASKTSDRAGDGTTTATVLAEAIFAEGLKAVTAGANPVAVKRGIDRAVAAATESLQEMAKPVRSRQQISNVGAISANGDTSVGELLADAIDRVGRDGVITVEEAKSFETTLSVVDGMEFDKGYISPYFITDPDKMSTVLEDAYVLFFEKKISNVRQLLPVLEAVAQKSAPLLIIAEDVEAEALSALVVNRLRGVLSVAAVKAPGFGDRRKAMLDDMAVLTGGTSVTEDLGVGLEGVELSQLGRVGRVEITKDSTLLVNGNGTKKAIRERIDMLRGQIESTTSDYDREKLTERLARLSGGIAVVGVGAATEAEMNEKKARVEDALHATRAAVEEGIVPGGGTALLRTTADIETAIKRLKGDEKTGARIVLKALEAPAFQIAENAGFDGALCVEGTTSSEKAVWGFDAREGKHRDMLKAGIIDPVKVTRSALQHAGSVAGLMLSMSAAITDLADEVDPIEGAVS